eukprot:1138818-Pelagomonas_calceolata.AAC.3
MAVLFEYIFFPHHLCRLFQSDLTLMGYGGRWEVCPPTVRAQAENGDVTERVCSSGNFPAQEKNEDMTGRTYGSGTELDHALQTVHATIMPEVWFRGFLEPQFEGGHEVGWRH